MVILIEWPIDVEILADTDMLKVALIPATIAFALTVVPILAVRVTVAVVVAVKVPVALEGVPLYERYAGVTPTKSLPQSVILLYTHPGVPQPRRCGDTTDAA